MSKARNDRVRAMPSSCGDTGATTAEIWLVRHASHSALGEVLTGRAACPGLSELGFAEAAALARRLQGTNVARIEASPRLRTRQTAAVIADALQLAVDVVPALDEVDFGVWNGARFADLASDPAWQRWNAVRSTERPPRGEAITDVRRRVLGHLLASAQSNVGLTVMVTHAEIIRTVLLAAKGLGADDWAQITVMPASLTRVTVAAGNVSLASMPSELVA